MPDRDLQAERDHAEWVGWAEAQGYDSNDNYAEYGVTDVSEAFTAGMQAGRDLAAVAAPQPAPELEAVHDQLRDRLAVLAASLDADALATAPSRKSEIQAEAAKRIREALATENT